MDLFDPLDNLVFKDLLPILNLDQAPRCRWLLEGLVFVSAAHHEQLSFEVSIFIIVVVSQNCVVAALA